MNMTVEKTNYWRERHGEDWVAHWLRLNDKPYALRAPACNGAYSEILGLSDDDVTELMNASQTSEGMKALLQHIKSVLDGKFTVWSWPPKEETEMKQRHKKQRNEGRIEAQRERKYTRKAETLERKSQRFWNETEKEGANTKDFGSTLHELRKRGVQW